MQNLGEKDGYCGLLLLLPFFFLLPTLLSFSLFFERIVTGKSIGSFES